MLVIGETYDTTAFTDDEVHVKAPLPY